MAQVIIKMSGSNLCRNNCSFIRHSHVNVLALGIWTNAWQWANGLFQPSWNRLYRLVAHGRSVADCQELTLYYLHNFMKTNCDVWTSKHKRPVVQSTSSFIVEYGTGIHSNNRRFEGLKVLSDLILTFLDQKSRKYVGSTKSGWLTTHKQFCYSQNYDD